MAQLQPNGGEVTCTTTVQLHSQQVQNDCKLRQWSSQQTYNKHENIIYCKMHQHISHLHISHSNNLKYWRAFWLLWICTNILQSCMHRISRWITLSSFSINIENMNYFTHDQEQKKKTFCSSQVWLRDRVRWPSKCPSIITQSDSISIRSPSIFFLP